MEIPIDPLLQTQVRFKELPPVVWEKSSPADLIPGRVEIWRFNINLYLSYIQEFYDLLESEEKTRSSRLVKEIDRLIFIGGKALLRILLGKYLKINPREVSFAYSQKKKPSLKNACNSSIHFNVSHSGPYILIAVADEEVGIDVEYYEGAAFLKSDMDLLFSKAEVSFINNQHSPLQAYHKLWTRKEALLKGTSQGIIDGFRWVPSLNGTHAINSEVIKSCIDWSVYSFEADKFCTASVAYTGLNKKIIFNELIELGNIKAISTQNLDYTVKRAINTQRNHF